jgi:hypothetical protein
MLEFLATSKRGVCADIASHSPEAD